MESYVTLMPRREGFCPDANYEYVELDPQRETCGGCKRFRRCALEGHESIGWCEWLGEFFHEDDEGCE